MSTPGTLNYPASLDDSTSLFELANRALSTLSGSITNSATSLTLASAALFPSTGVISIDSEIIYYTGKSTNTLTGLIRGRDGTSAASHSSGASVGQRITSAHHEILRDAIIAVQTAIGVSGSFNFVDKVNAQTGIAGAKTFTGVMTHIQAPASDGAQGSSATAYLLRGADSTSGAPNTNNEASVYLQTFRSGGTAGTAKFSFNFNTTTTGTMNGNTYGLYLVTRLGHSISGTSDRFHEGIRSNMINGMTGGLGSNNVVSYAFTANSERVITGVRGVGYYVDQRNSTSSDANESPGSIDTMYAMVFSADGISHNTGQIYFEGPSNATSSYWGLKAAANSLCQRALDFTDTTFTLQGTTWAANAASNQVTISSGGHAAVEAIAGDWIKVSGVYCKVASATANAITLTGLYSSFGGSGTPTGLTITKSVQPLWLANQSFISAINAAGNARYALAGLNSSDGWSVDPDGRNITFGSTRFFADMSNATISSRFHFQTSTASSSTVIGAIPSSGGSASAWRVFMNSDPNDSAFGGILINTSSVQISSTRNGTTFSVLPMEFLIGTTRAAQISVNRSFVIGTATALATNATDGFLYIPTCAGTPTGAPTSFTGSAAMVYDTSANKFWMYNGSWRSVTLT